MGLVLLFEMLGALSRSADDVALLHARPIPCAFVHRSAPRKRPGRLLRSAPEDVRALAGYYARAGFQEIPEGATPDFARMGARVGALRLPEHRAPQPTLATAQSGAKHADRARQIASVVRSGARLPEELLPDR
jgi:hypothetical protein